MVKFNYRPLPENLIIKESDIEGHGIHANQDIGAAVNLGKTHFKHAGSWCRTPLGGFINHSDNPNCVIITFINGTEKELWTVRPISPSEELTVYYTLGQE